MALCDKWVALKIVEFVFCVACLVYKRVSADDEVRLSLQLQKLSREWSLLTSVTWDSIGGAFADAVYGGNTTPQLVYTVLVDGEVRLSLQLQKLSREWSLLTSVTWDSIGGAFADAVYGGNTTPQLVYTVLVDGEVRLSLQLQKLSREWSLLTSVTWDSIGGAFADAVYGGNTTPQLVYTVLVDGEVRLSLQLQKLSREWSLLTSVTWDSIGGAFADAVYGGNTTPQLVYTVLVDGEVRLSLQLQKLSREWSLLTSVTWDSIGGAFADAVYGGNTTPQLVYTVLVDGEVRLSLQLQKLSREWSLLTSVTWDSIGGAFADAVYGGNTTPQLVYTVLVDGEVRLSLQLQKLSREWSLLTSVTWDSIGGAFADAVYGGNTTPQLVYTVLVDGEVRLSLQLQKLSREWSLLTSVTWDSIGGAFADAVYGGNTTPQLVYTVLVDGEVRLSLHLQKLSREWSLLTSVTWDSIGGAFADAVYGGNTTPQLVYTVLVDGEVRLSLHLQKLSREWSLLTSVTWDSIGGAFADAVYGGNTTPQLVYTVLVDGEVRLSLQLQKLSREWSLLTSVTWDSIGGAFADAVYGGNTTPQLVYTVLVDGEVRLSLQLQKLSREWSLLTSVTWDSIGGAFADAVYGGNTTPQLVYTVLVDGEVRLSLQLQKLSREWSLLTSVTWDSIGGAFADAVYGGNTTPQLVYTVLVDGEVRLSLQLQKLSREWSLLTSVTWDSIGGAFADAVYGGNTTPQLVYTVLVDGEVRLSLQLQKLSREWSLLTSVTWDSIGGAFADAVYGGNTTPQLVYTVLVDGEVRLSLQLQKLSREWSLLTSVTWDSIGGAFADAVYGGNTTPQLVYTVLVDGEVRLSLQLQKLSREWSLLTSVTWDSIGGAFADAVYGGNTTPQLVYTVLVDGEVRLSLQLQKLSREWSLLTSVTWDSIGGAFADAVYGGNTTPQLVYTVLVDGEVRLSLQLQKLSREWSLLTSVTWDSIGGAFADAVYGGYVIITFGLLVARIFQEIPRGRRILEGFFLGFGMLFFLVLGGLELSSLDSVPHNLVVNASVLGSLSLVVAALFLIDLMAPRIYTATHHSQTEPFSSPKSDKKVTILTKPNNNAIVSNGKQNGHIASEKPKDRPKDLDLTQVNTDKTDSPSLFDSPNSHGYTKFDDNIEPKLEQSKFGSLRSGIEAGNYVRISDPMSEHDKLHYEQELAKFNERYFRDYLDNFAGKLHCKEDYLPELQTPKFAKVQSGRLRSLYDEVSPNYEKARQKSPTRAKTVPSPTMQQLEDYLKGSNKSRRSETPALFPMAPIEERDREGTDHVDRASGTPTDPGYVQYTAGKWPDKREIRTPRHSPK